MNTKFYESSFHSKIGNRCYGLQVIRHKSGAEWRGLIPYYNAPPWSEDNSLVHYKFESDDGWIAWLYNAPCTTPYGYRRGVIKPRIGKIGKKKITYWEVNDAGKAAIEAATRKHKEENAKALAE